MDHEAIKNASMRIAEVQSALEDIQRVLRAAERVEQTAEKSIKVMRPVAMAAACGLVVFAIVAAVRRRHR